MYELEPYVYEGEIVDEECQRCGADGESVIDPYTLALDGHRGPDRPVRRLLPGALR